MYKHGYILHITDVYIQLYICTCKYRQVCIGYQCNGDTLKEKKRKKRNKKTNNKVNNKNSNGNARRIEPQKRKKREKENRKSGKKRKNRH